MARSHADRVATIRRRVEQARAGDARALELVNRFALDDLEQLLADLDAAALVARMNTAVVDALRAVARGNPREGVALLAGVLQRSGMHAETE